MISQRLIAGQFTRLNRKSEAAVPSRGLAKAKWFHPQSPFPPGYNLFASTASTGAAVSEAKKVVLDLPPLKLKVTKLGELPVQPNAPVQSAFNVNGTPYIVSNAELFSLDMKTMKFTRQEYAGTLAHDYAHYNPKRNVVYFQRNRRLEWGGANFQILDMKNMTVTDGAENPAVGQTCTFSQGKLHSFGWDEQHLYYDWAAMLHIYNDEKNVWERTYYDGQSKSVPAAREEWIINNINDDIYLQVHSGRRLETTDSWKFDAKKHSIKPYETGGEPPKYHRHCASFVIESSGSKKIVTYGGIHNLSNNIVNNISSLDIENNYWESIPIISGYELNNRFRAKVVSISPKQVILFGGEKENVDRYNEFLMIEAE